MAASPIPQKDKVILGYTHYLQEYDILSSDAGFVDRFRTLYWGIYNGSIYSDD